MRVDLKNVADQEAIITVPEGEYDVRIVDVVPGTTRDGDERWGLRLEVTQGPCAGKHAGWDGLVWSERGMPRAKRVLEVLGFAVDGELELEPEHLIGLQGHIELIHEEYETRLGTMNKRMGVPYRGWSPVGGSNGNGAEGAVDEEARSREALARDSPF